MPVAYCVLMCLLCLSLSLCVTSPKPVFSYSYETCANNWQKCSSFADCRDYSGGYCCHCRPGYYGDGRDCVAEGKESPPIPHNPDY